MENAESVKEAAASSEAAAAPQIDPPRFVEEARRFRSVPLEWPITYGGQVYDQITIRRMTADEVRQFVDAAANGLKPSLPIFDVPDAVLAALDADDDAEVEKAVNDFLPRSLRAEIEQTSAAGSTTSASQPQD
ncbi:hypothetical protein OCAR_5594 [Afipia carboxidovorans OM5]|uniref:Uncharacterized protein n=1 Tax=Afipia carboxidovorans (strain ATCC 49405 / DSM 1227 / KCTC 32145 / OM5) TaxID=504832 RepID=B6JEG0_AFIC5|nr:phage tail assembly protein [Afipia carboxidovorans]ACI92725.1 hypothetical protein OCAR_5594 [Afipia carboxidovorans OM5]AEI03523.1 hypothetical protein OCA4_c24030 [Afipia carboxidovorans OM4]AEI07100.1 hypothetical protein OCA5_c24040 [Afipia carboxidovorans OM5]BEV44675.1 hypothetical protein CRBSH125_08580 [Afipia carboxidovorans]